MSVLVTGGAGYIGSVVVEDLRERGLRPVVLDNLSRGHRQAVDDDVPFYHGDIGDKGLVAQILSTHQIDVCMNLSGLAYVGESVENPIAYFDNNAAQTLNLLEMLIASGVRRFVFSSSCTTYGEPLYQPIDEKHPQNPTSPYGWSKFIIERALEAYDTAYGLKFVVLRYFNACGATATRGQDHDPETRIIPLALFAAMGKIPFLSIFGDDYPTPDGTAVRDYIHISDLSRAHLLALDHLAAGGQSEFVNLGNGNGYSVRQVVEIAEKVTGKPVPTRIAPRRPGDPSQLVADATKAREVLKWKPQFPELETIVESAWNWHRKNPDGYR